MSACAHDYKLWISRPAGEWPHMLQLPEREQRTSQAKAITIRAVPPHDADRWFDRETGESEGDGSNIGTEKSPYVQCVSS